MSMTAFGWIWMVGLLVATLRMGWFVAVLAFSVVLQAASVIDIPVNGALFGISPYVLCGMVAGLHLLRYAARSPHEVLRELLRPPLRWLLLYFIVAAFGALILPHVFAGMPVYSLLGLGGFDVPKEPLSPGISQIAQILNTAVHSAVAAFLVVSARKGDWQARHIGAGMGGGALFVVFIGLHDRVALLFDGKAIGWFFVNNPGYKLYHLDELGGIARVYAPFSEPSYASAYLAAVLVALLMHLAFGKSRLAATAIAAGSVGLALINTLGATGLLAGFIGLCVVLSLTTLKALLRRDRESSRVRVVLTLVLVVVSTAGAVLIKQRLGGGFESLQQAAQEKLQSDSVRNRHASNRYAVTLLGETYGLGVGLGGNRASSFVASLVSNTGVPGLLLFIISIGAIARSYLGRRMDDVEVLAAGGLVGALIAVSVGIPDLNIPLFWMFVFVAMGLSTQRKTSEVGG